MIKFGSPGLRHAADTDRFRSEARGCTSDELCKRSLTVIKEGAQANAIKIFWVLQKFYKLAVDNNNKFIITDKGNILS